MRWQVQTAKQRFSEVLREAATGEPQVVTRHGEEVAVVLDIREYRRLRGEDVELRDVLLEDIDEVSDEFAEAFAADMEAIVAARDLPREVDLGED
ncbi:type II toxin-antitoxin system Phd/YefM family antitoxin [Streptomyces sp. 6N223]